MGSPTNQEIYGPRLNSKGLMGAPILTWDGETRERHCGRHSTARPFEHFRSSRDIFGPNARPFGRITQILIICAHYCFHEALKIVSNRSQPSSNGLIIICW